jgi:hypothetical protein
VGAGDDLREVVGKVGEIEVAMRVDEHLWRLEVRDSRVEEFIVLGLGMGRCEYWNIAIFKYSLLRVIGGGDRWVMGG